MTKQEFCKQIVQTVDNCRSIDKMNDDEIAQELSGLIVTLVPKDKKRFASWGKPEHQTTTDKCWEG